MLDYDVTDEQNENNNVIDEFEMNRGVWWSAHFSILLSDIDIGESAKPSAFVCDSGTWLNYHVHDT